MKTKTKAIELSICPRETLHTMIRLSLFAAAMVAFVFTTAA